MARHMFQTEDGAAFGRHCWMIVRGLDIQPRYSELGVIIRPINTRGVSDAMRLDIPIEELDGVIAALTDERDRMHADRERRKAKMSDRAKV